MRKLIIIACLLGLITGCGQSYEETKRQTRAEQRRLWQEDSAAFKVAVMPTLDCMPFYVARQLGLFDSLDVKVKLKAFTAQMDCDTALAGGSVEAAVTDLVRAERLMGQGTPLRYVTATDAHWQLVTHRTARIRQLKGLDDRMVAMTRYSATDLLADAAVDSARLKPERVFRIQVNDVNIRFLMLQNNIMDAMLLTEPLATAARLAHHAVVLDTRKMDLALGVVACREKALQNPARQQQLERVMKAYNQACDLLNKNGIAAYGDLLATSCGVKREVADSLPKNLRFTPVAEPRKRDIERAKAWLKQKDS